MKLEGFLKESIKEQLELGELLSIAKNKKINTVEGLKSYLDTEIALVRKWLSENRDASLTDKRREHTRKLELLRKMNDALETLGKEKSKKLKIRGGWARGV